MWKSSGITAIVFCIAAQASAGTLSSGRIDAVNDQEQTLTISGKTFHYGDDVTAYLSVEGNQKIPLAIIPEGVWVRYSTKDNGQELDKLWVKDTNRLLDQTNLP